MLHQVYPVLQMVGSPMAVFENDRLYYGAFPNNAPIAVYSGGWIYIGPFASGYSDYQLQGNAVYAGSCGRTIFTIRGNRIYDGCGSTPFLYCPTGHSLALAMAACCFAGDMSLRLDASNVVDRNEYEGALSPHVRESQFDYTRNGRHATRNLGSTPLANRFGNKEWSPNASENINQMKVPVSVYDKQENSGMTQASVATPQFSEVENDNAHEWAREAEFARNFRNTEEGKKLAREQAEQNAKDRAKRGNFEKSIPKYREYRETIDRMVSEKQQRAKTCYEKMYSLFKVLFVLTFFSGLAIPFAYGFLGIAPFIYCIGYLYLLVMIVVGIGIVANEPKEDEDYRERLERKYGIYYNKYFSISTKPGVGPKKP